MRFNYALLYLILFSNFLMGVTKATDHKWQQPFLINMEQFFDNNKDSEINSPPREYFSIHTLFLDKYLIQVGFDQINNTYVVMPSPNIIELTENQDGSKKAKLQLYFADTQQLIQNSFQAKEDQIQYLHIRSLVIYDQLANQIHELRIPEGVHYRPPQFMDVIIPPNTSTLSFIFSFIGRTAWSDSGIKAQIKGLYNDLRRVDVAEDARLSLNINAQQGINTFEVFTHEENNFIQQIVSQLHDIVVWGSATQRENLLLKVENLKNFEAIDVDLNNYLQDMQRYPHIFGEPPKEKWVSIIRKLSTESLSEEEYENESEISGKLGIEKIFGLNGSSNSKTKTRIKKIVKFDLEGEIYIPKSLNFSIRKQNYMTLLKGLLLRIYPQLKEVEYKFGVGLSMQKVSQIPRSINLTPSPWTKAINGYHAPINFKCPNSSVLTGVKSTHLNSQEDRLFYFQCSKVSYNPLPVLAPEQLPFALNQCIQSQTLNNIDAPVNFQCSEDQFLVGTASIYSYKARDRQFKYQCCQFSDIKTKSGVKKGNCSWSNWANQLDGPVNFVCTQNQAITGVQSVHSNKHEDRKYRYQCCDMEI